MTEAAPSEVAPPRQGCRIGLAELLALIFVIGLLVSLGVPALVRTRRMAGRSQCANHLYQIGMASLVYADGAKGLFPHLGPTAVLDGGGSTRPRGSDVSPRLIRHLYWVGMVDPWPEFAICPGSTDEVDPAVGSARPAGDRKKFGWAGTTNAAGLSPLVAPAPKDLDAAALTDLSYGYTIRGLTSNTKSSTPVAADRARENHVDGWTVVFADAHIEWVARGTAEAKRLSGTADGDGFLVVWDEANAPGR